MGVVLVFRNSEICCLFGFSFYSLFNLWLKTGVLLLMLVFAKKKKGWSFIPELHKGNPSKLLSGFFPLRG